MFCDFLLCDFMPYASICAACHYQRFIGEFILFSNHGVDSVVIVQECDACMAMECKEASVEMTLVS